MKFATKSMKYFQRHLTYVAALPDQRIRGFLNDMRYINSRFTTYLLTHFGKLKVQIY